MIDNYKEILADALSDVSCNSDIESEDFEESDDADLIPRPRTINGRTISTGSETSTDEKAEEYCSGRFDINVVA